MTSAVVFVALDAATTKRCLPHGSAIDAHDNARIIQPTAKVNAGLNGRTVFAQIPTMFCQKMDEINKTDLQSGRETTNKLGERKTSKDRITENGTESEFLRAIKTPDSVGQNKHKRVAIWPIRETKIRIVKTHSHATYIRVLEWECRWKTEPNAIT